MPRTDRSGGEVITVPAQVNFRADRIAALRHLARAAGAAESRQLRLEAERAQRNQVAAFGALMQVLIRDGVIGFARETRPRAFEQHEQILRDAQIVGAFPWGAERSVIYASAAILFEDEARVIGDRLTTTLLGPVEATFGPEPEWIELATVSR